MAAAAGNLLIAASPNMFNHPASTHHWTTVVFTLFGDPVSNIEKTGVKFTKKSTCKLFSRVFVILKGWSE